MPEALHLTYSEIKHLFAHNTGQGPHNSGQNRHNGTVIKIIQLVISESNPRITGNQIDQIQSPTILKY